MRLLRNETGAALVTALMLTMLALVISMALLYTVTVGTKVSASQKRYRSALAAAHGGVELLTREIVPRLLQAQSATTLQDQFGLIDLQLPGYDCLRQKLTSATAKWSACSQAQSSSDPTSSPDVSFTLSGLPAEPRFTVSSKIVDTVPGNSDPGPVGSEFLESGDSVSARDEVIHPRHVPALYNIAVQGAGGGGREKARLSLLYAY